MDTIFAVASGLPPSAIAIVRISGSRAIAVATDLAGALPKPRRAGLRALRRSDGGVLDRALVLVAPGPNSATGEDIVELHLHGGRAVVVAVMDYLAQYEGLRLAAPGEFTRRALENGRIDLAQAEGLGDLLMAETETQRRAAILSAEGAVSRAVDGWNARLIALSAEVEAQLDFSDEDDVGTAPALEITQRAIRGFAGQIETLLAAPTVTRLRDGIRVVLAGPPNSGKSTLLNALVERDAAIVSSISGTTRDLIEVPVMRSGIAFLLTDTAGLAPETTDPIEQIGISRARGAIASADIVLWLGDDRPPDYDDVWLYPRADTRPPPPMNRLAVSATTGEGVDRLWTTLTDRSFRLLPREDQLALNDRQHALCAEALAALQMAARADDPLVVAEELRLARRAFDRITGRTGVEAVLDDVFGRFCIGK